MPVQETYERMLASIGERITQLYGYPPAATANWLFYQGLPPAKRPLAWLINLFSPSVFTHDRLVVSELSSARTRQEVDDAIGMLHRAPAYEHAFVRATLGCRVSGRRLAAVAGRLLEKPAV